MCVSEGKTCLFFGKFDVLCFLETPVLRFAFFQHSNKGKSYRLFVEILFTLKFTLEFLLRTRVSVETGFFLFFVTLKMETKSVK